MKILIPNASSPKNLGDQAILLGLLGVLNTTYQDTYTVLHTYDPHLHRGDASLIQNSICSWVAFDKKNFLTRIFRLIQLLVVLISKGKLKAVVSKGLRNIIDDYKNADLIIFTGGGYLRSNKGLMQALNLLLQLSMFYWATISASEKKKIVGPVSFGPFAYRWQERLAASLLKKMSAVLAREDISIGLLSKYNLSNIVPAADLAFLLEAPQQEMQPEELSAGFTVREWGTREESKILQQQIIEGLTLFSQKTGAVLVPFVQVDAPEYGDRDFDVVSSIAKELQNRGVQVLPVRRITSVEAALREYSHVSILFAMRMHANILSAVSGTPFIAIAYEHKTQGIANMLGLEAFAMPYDKITREWLVDTGLKALANREHLSAAIKNKIESIRTHNFELWRRLL